MFFRKPSVPAAPVAKATRQVAKTLTRTASEPEKAPKPKIGFECRGH